MAKAYINTSDYNRLIKKFRGLKSIDKNGLPFEFLKMASNAEIDMKNDVPVDTGDLKKSITHRLDNKDLIFEVNMKYGPYVEFGTGKKVELKALQRLGIPDSYALQFKGKDIRQVNLPPRPFFYDNARKHLKKLMKSIKTKIKTMI